MVDSIWATATILGEGEGEGEGCTTSAPHTAVVPVVHSCVGGYLGVSGSNKPHLLMVVLFEHLRAHLYPLHQGQYITMETTTAKDNLVVPAQPSRSISVS